MLGAVDPDAGHVAGQATPHYALEADFSYEKVPCENGYEDLNDFFDAVADHLAELGADDIFVAHDDQAQTFVVSLLVSSREYESIETAVGKGMGLIRTALHACHGQTPGWPTASDALFRGARLTPVSLVGQTAGESPILSSV